MHEKPVPFLRRMLPVALFLVALVAAVLLVTRVISVKADAEALGLAQRNLCRAAVECYALEGFYPTEVSYLADHYGVTLDETRFVVHYEFIASNLMPQITVLPPG